MDIIKKPTRRQLMQTLGAAALAGPILTHTPLWGQSACAVLGSPSLTEGPYFVDEDMNRRDIRVDPADGSIQAGIPLSLAINVSQITTTNCTPTALTGAYVESGTAMLSESTPTSPPKTARARSSSAAINPRTAKATSTSSPSTPAGIKAAPSTSTSRSASSTDRNRPTNSPASSSSTSHSRTRSSNRRHMSPRARATRGTPRTASTAAPPPPAPSRRTAARI